MYKRTVQKKIDRRGRKTQPITFDEIKEVDEEIIEDPLHGRSAHSLESDSKERKSNSEIDLKENFSEFSRNLSQRRRRQKSKSK